ncbi:YfcE family phosphodiesterase [Wukongibacter baidiensis]|uniref:metallophosphoesterase family protein n=1 Tax=Wukongibacter baidiensis TaxID=1723361 RepID=UPI003D7F27E2
MKIAVLSDIHGNDLALKAVIDDLKKEGIEKVIFLGDLVMRGPNPKMSLELLKKLDILSWVKGNTDGWFEEANDGWSPKTDREKMLFELYLYALNELEKEDIDFLMSKPITEKIKVNGLSVLCVHGSPRSYSEIMGEEIEKEKLLEILDGVDEELILCGHSHKPSIVKVGQKTIVNVGSVGMPYVKNIISSYAVLEILDEEFEISMRQVNYDKEGIIEAAIAKRFPYIEKYIRIIEEGVAS